MTPKKSLLVGLAGKLPALRYPCGVVCTACGARYIFGDTGVKRYYDYTDTTGVVSRYKPGPGSPCCLSAVKAS